MKKEITDEILIAYIEGEANDELEIQLASDSSLKKRLEDLQEVLDAIQSSEQVDVPAHIEMSFDQALSLEKQKGHNGFSWMQLAAAIALLIVGFGAGKLSTNSNADDLVALKNEIHSLREVTLRSTLQKHSASERIMAVNQIEENDQLNNELIATLITTLNSDESPNVRYAALQALTKFMDNESVRAELVKSIESQTDPLIQITLITILVQAEERSAIAPLKEIIEKEETSPEVKQQAEIAIQVLT